MSNDPESAGSASPPGEIRRRCDVMCVAGHSAEVKNRSLTKKKVGEETNRSGLLRCSHGKQAAECVALPTEPLRAGGLNVKESLCQCKYRLPSVFTPFVTHQTLNMLQVRAWQLQDH